MKNLNVLFRATGRAGAIYHCNRLRFPNKMIHSVIWSNDDTLNVGDRVNLVGKRLNKALPRTIAFKGNIEPTGFFGIKLTPYFLV